MPSYPKAQQVVHTDIVVYPSELPKFPGDEDLVIRAILDPDSLIMSVHVFARVTGLNGAPDLVREIGSREVFRAVRQPPEPEPEPGPYISGHDDPTMSPDPDRPNPMCRACGSFLMPSETACGNCGNPR